MADRQEEGTYLLPGVYTAEDIRQERHLAELQGKPKRPIRFYLLENKRRHLSLGANPDYLLGRDRSVGLDGLPELEGPSDSELERLLHWLGSQSRETQQLVFDYLTDPTDEKLDQVVQSAGLEKSTRASANNPHFSLADLIQRALPATHEELLALARREHPSKRPEAAARQALRRLVRRGLIIKKESTSDGKVWYHKSGETT